ncbi:MAG TPA: metalloregulator ArsR/SmtB family transcription factor [Anaerolineae bacterium]|jgi:ArsR family transcriptional regulator|nr:metalloregulator ArsR/SmtB family transcription factor [Anaerolineae bacterium]
MKSSRKSIELLKVIANPLRIEILEQLEEGVKCVSDFEESIEASQPNISQHLAILRRHCLIDYYVDGRLRCYFLVDPIVPDLLKILRKQYKGSLPAPACCPVTKKGTYPGARRR